MKAALRVGGAAALVGAGTLAALALLAAPAATVQAQPAAAPARTEVAIFAGGCFWCVEADFDKVRGVISTTSGYTGGKVANPSYEQVSSKSTGHAEAVRIVYDPAVVSYKALLGHYWKTTDPTTADRQFCDVGSPYRPAIFATDDAQYAAALASRAEVEKTKPFKEPIVTAIERAGAFYAAEEYHQDYYHKNPVRYNYYRAGCGRDLRLKQLWGSH